MFAYGKTLAERQGPGFQKAKHAKFEVGKISELIEYSFNLIQKRIHEAGGVCGVSKDEVRVLGWRAFTVVYRRGKGGTGGRAVISKLLGELVERNERAQGRVREEGGRDAWGSEELKEAAKDGLQAFDLPSFKY